MGINITKTIKYIYQVCWDHMMLIVNGYNFNASLCTYCKAVSYTHLDVYKRQVIEWINLVN